MGAGRALVVGTDEVTEPDRDVLGGKGAGLVRMTQLGLAVPEAFVLTTECGRRSVAAGELPDGVLASVRAHIGRLEERASRGFGDPTRPLLVSVRSGAPVSMPGMMDTILNCGLTWDGAESLAAETGDEGFAFSSLERLLRSFAVTVRGVSEGVVEEALLDAASGARARERCRTLERVLESESGAAFPDAWGQLEESIRAVFASWNSRRAVAYRRHKGMTEDTGTAVVVQRMVFGNTGAESCSGVAFTRDPATGAAGGYGEVLFDAQGEDVVDGSQDADPLAVLGERMPATMAELDKAMSTLERAYRDMCDIEFTVERGRLWILQTRVGQRSARAAVRLAVAMVDEGLIDEAEAVRRVTRDQVDGAYSPMLELVDDDRVIARGLPASPGAAVGEATFDPEACAARTDDGPAVLIRPTTSPADIPGILEAAAVVTGRGGRTSHAAVTTRGLGKPAVCGAGAVEAAPDGRGITIDGRPVSAGETVSVDGDRGLLVRGRAAMVDAGEDPMLARFAAMRASQH